MIKDKKIGIIGLGYVGLPLAIEFAKKGFYVIGYDIKSNRIDKLKKGIDDTKEIEKTELNLPNLKYTSQENDLSTIEIFIITVPTPIDKFKQPDLSYLLSASELVGRYLKKDALVVYESTVYPGCTEEECVPILEKNSGLKFNTDFFCGYSPERINPGDKKRKVHNITKVTSGSTKEIADVVDALYNSIVTAGTYKVSSIKVAEASKIIENIQRDVNISLVNELALIFDRLAIDTLEVLQAAGTKWNFLPFRPGLVGGHCIGVDPYYLTHKAESLGYHPDVILSGRRVNDNMGNYIAHKVVKLMVKNDLKINNSNILILGITFKENCGDIRNSRIIDLYSELIDFGANVDVYDPFASNNEVLKTYTISLIPDLNKTYDGIILAVSHTKFSALDLDKLKSSKQTVIYDIKSFFPKEEVTDRL